MSSFSSCSQCVVLFALILACGLYTSDAQETIGLPIHLQLLDKCLRDNPAFSPTWSLPVPDWGYDDCKCRGGRARDFWTQVSGTWVNKKSCDDPPPFNCETNFRCTRRRRLMEMSYFRYLDSDNASCIEARNAFVNLSTTATAECMNEGKSGTCSMTEREKGCAKTEEIYAYFKTMSLKGVPGIVLNSSDPQWFDFWVKPVFYRLNLDWEDTQFFRSRSDNTLQIYMPGAQLNPEDPYWWMNVLFQNASEWATNFVVYPKPNFCNEFNTSKYNQPDPYTDRTETSSNDLQRALSKDSQKLNQVFCTCLGYPDAITTCPIPYASNLTQAQNCMAAYSRTFLSMMDTYTRTQCNATMRERILSSYVNYGGHYLCEMHSGLSARNLPESYLPEITRAWKEEWTQIVDPKSLQSCARSVSIATELDKKDCQCKGGTYDNGCVNLPWSCEYSACNRRRRIAELEAYSPYLASAGEGCDQARHFLTAAASSGRDQCVKEVSGSNCYDASRSCDNVTGIYSFFKSQSLNNASGLVLRSRFSTTSNLTDLKRSISVKLNIVPEDLLVWVPRDDGVMQIYAAGYAALDSTKPVSTVPVEEQLVPFSDLLESVLPPKPALCTSTSTNSMNTERPDLMTMMSRDCSSTEDDRNALQKAMDALDTSFCSCLGLGTTRSLCMVPYGLALTKVQECVSVLARSKSTSMDAFARKHCNATTFQKVNVMTRTVMGRNLVCSPYFAGGLSESSMQPLLNAWEAAATTTAPTGSPTSTPGPISPKSNATNFTTGTNSTAMAPKSKSAVGAIVGAVVGVLVLVGLLLFARYMWVKKHSQGEGSYDDDYHGKSTMNKELLDV